MRLFLDANVLFSAAHNAEGNCRALFRLAASARSRLISSRYAVEEATRNLSLKYPEHLAELERLALGLEVAPEPAPAAAEAAMAHRLPAEDAPILAAAIQSRADALVTGDRRHFGKLYGVVMGGVQVLTPVEAVQVLMKVAARNSPPGSG